MLGGDRSPQRHSAVHCSLSPRQGQLFSYDSGLRKKLADNIMEEMGIIRGT